MKKLMFTFDDDCFVYFRGGPNPTANNTLNRPRMDLGGPNPHYTPDTSPMGGRPGQVGNHHPPHGNNLAYANDRYHDDRLRVRVTTVQTQIFRSLHLKGPLTPAIY